MCAVISPWCSEWGKFTVLSHALQCYDGMCMWGAVTHVKYLHAALVTSRGGFNPYPTNVENRMSS